MDASIKDNISFFSNDISNTQIEESIDKANLRKFINQFPDGLNSKIGEKTTRFLVVKHKELLLRERLQKAKNFDFRRSHKCIRYKH